MHDSGHSGRAPGLAPDLSLTQASRTIVTCGNVFFFFVGEVCVQSYSRNFKDETYLKASTNVGEEAYALSTDMYI